MKIALRGLRTLCFSDSVPARLFSPSRLAKRIEKWRGGRRLPGPEQKVPVEAALAIWTRGNAYACFDEDIKGSVEAGKLADFVILSQDPTQVPPERIKDITVERTYVGGRLAFARTSP